MMAASIATRQQSQEVEEAIKRISGHRGVKNFTVINKDGLPLRTSMELNSATEQQVLTIHELTIAARRMVRDVDPTDNLLFLRCRSKQDEILISPDSDFSVVIIQENSDKHL